MLDNPMYGCTFVRPGVQVKAIWRSNGEFQIGLTIPRQSHVQVIFEGSEAGLRGLLMQMLDELDAVTGRHTNHDEAPPWENVPLPFEDERVDEEPPGLSVEEELEAIQQGKSIPD